ncbi:MAG TPA: DUF1127 domain-containing protein [Gammaproteobacteria bacterium]|nr:DUF1127 domain-containing protein [Gammaproteobacteria bacterium]
MKPESIQFPHAAPPATGLSRTELDRYLRRAHCLRAAAFSRLIKRVARGLRTLFRGLKQARDRRSAVAELRRLDERTLKDIGVERGQIPLIVEQLLARRRAEGEPRKAYPLKALVAPPATEAANEDDERCPPLAA